MFTNLRGCSIWPPKRGDGLAPQTLGGHSLKVSLLAGKGKCQRAVKMLDKIQACFIIVLGDKNPLPEPAF